MELSKKGTQEEVVEKVETKKENPLVVQKYIIKVNPRKDGYHPLPKKERKDTGKITSQYLTIHGQPTQAIIRGLNNLQERNFSYMLINKTPKDQNFDEVMTYYWADYVIDIPEKGLSLDASYTKKTVIIEGREEEIEDPLYLDQYIKARFAKQSSRVAFTEEQKQNRDLYDFVIEDLSVEQKNKEDMFKLTIKSDSAINNLFVESTEESHEKVNWLLELLKEPNELFYSASYTDKCIKLKEIQKENPSKFLEVFNDSKLEQKALLFTLVQTGVISKEGNAYMYQDTLLGSTETEALLFLSDQTKSSFVVKLKSSLKEILTIKG